MNNKYIVILFLSFLTVTLSAQNIQWRGDRTGIYKETGLLKSWPENGPAMVWNYKGLGDGYSSVAISSDKIYLTGMTNGKGSIYVLDLAGKLLNKKEYGNEWTTSYEGTRGTITVNDGKLYLVSGMGEIYCFDESTLNLVWKKNFLREYNASNIEWGINEAPLIIDDKVIVTAGGKTHNIVALNKNTGALVWSTPGEGDLSAYCSPLYIGDQQVPQIVTLTANHIIGVEVATGKKLWSYKNSNRYSIHANTPVYADNMLLSVGSDESGAVMLRLTNGGRNVERMWQVKEFDNRMGGMVKVGNYVYGSGNSRNWYCVDWRTGEIKFNERIAMGAVVANDGMLYCYTDRGEMLLVKASPDKFDIVSRFQVQLGTGQHWAHPVIHKGVMYVRHGDSLMAYNIK